MDNQSAIRISEREKAIKAWLKELIEVKGVKLPVTPDAVFEALEHIDSDAAIKEFIPNTEALQNLINQDKAQALVYEWFYDGGYVNNIYVDEDEPIAYTSCVFDGNPSKTDLLKLNNNDGFEVEPELDGMISHSVNNFCLDLVMNAWYEKLSSQYKDGFDAYYDLNNGTVDLDEVASAYEELFHLKLVSLIRESYLKALQEAPITITTDVPFHVFIQRHERWPMHVLSLNV